MARIGVVGRRVWGMRTIVHESAVVHETAVVHESAVVGEDTQIGPHCVVGPNAVISNCTLDRHVNIGPGCVVGHAGFGFLPKPHQGDQAQSQEQDQSLDVREEGGEDPYMVHKPQELRVVIGEFVVLGPQCNVARGSWRDTVIGPGCKLDALVQIGHNVVLGSAVLIAAQSGIAGSVTVGNRVAMGGQVGVAQHLSIADDVQIAGKSGVIGNITTPASVWGGYPAVPISVFRRNAIRDRHSHGHLSASPSS